MTTLLPRCTTILTACLLFTAGLAPAVQAAVPRDSAALVQIGMSTKLGPVLENSQGKSLYTLSSEAGGTLHCTGGCLTVWPPVLVPSGSTAPSTVAGVTGTFGTLTRPEGTQLTLNGFPLYAFVNDKAPGDTNGNGIFAASLGGTWHVAQIFTPLAATPVVRLNIRITATGATVWGRVTATYTRNGQRVQQLCSSSSCRLAVPQGSRITLEQSATSASTWPFAEWTIKRASRAGIRVDRHPAIVLRANRGLTVGVVYVVAGGGGGYSV